MTRGLTIGQAAAFTGVTVKAVRHYHRLGLIDEPRRDRSDYRRYGSADLLRLVQIRTLAAAGVPLAEIRTMIDAEPDRYATALDDVERRLTERIEDLIARRDTLRRLANGDRALLPDRACAFLDRLPGLGFTAVDVDETREALILVRALAPEDFDDYLTQVERGLDDPQWMSLIKRSRRAAEWKPHDPRVDELAAAMIDHLLAHPGLLPTLSGVQARTDGAARFELLRHHQKDQKPVWARLTALVDAGLRAAGRPVTASAAAQRHP